MTDLLFDHALVDGRWATDVQVSLGPDGSIRSVLPGADSATADRIRGAAVPGVPNVHSHAFQRGLAGLTQRGSTSGDTFWTWRAHMYAFLDALGPEDVRAIAAWLHVELLRRGFTALTEFHYLRNRPDGGRYDDPLELARCVVQAAEDSGMGLTLLPTVYRTSGFGGTPPLEAQRRFVATVEESLSDFETLALLVGGRDGRDGRAGLALHSLRAVPPSELDAAVAAVHASDPGAPVHIHVAEQTAEVDACLEWSGARPVEWLLEHAPVDERWSLIHATHLTTDETTAVADSGAVVGLCPTTEADLGDGIFPLPEYLLANGAFAIGTDAHVGTCPAAELRLLEYGQRLTTRRRNVAAGRAPRSTGRVLLDHALRDGARASGRPIGAIAEGRRADIVVLDTGHPVLAGRSGDEWIDSWLFSGQDSPVRDVMVGGRWVVRDGRHARQEAILGSYATAMERIRRRM